MLNIYKSLVNKELSHIFRLYKHNKFKPSAKSIITLSNQSNLTFHAASNNFIKTKRIRTSLSYSTRLLKDSENIYAYNILQTIPVANKDLFTVKTPNEVISTLDDFDKLLDQDWRRKSASEIVDGFKSVCNYCVENNINISDTRFDKLVDGFVDHVQDFTDTELLQLLECLIEYPSCDSYTAHNFHDMWSALDDVCCWKLSNWTNETMFTFAERWYQLNLGKPSDYVFNFIDRMQKRLHYITRDEVIHLFFYLKIHRRHKISFEAERVLDNFIADMSLREISIIAMTYIRHKHKLKLENTVAQIINKLKKDFTHADEICIRRTIEVLRYSTHVLLIDQLMDLLDNLVPEIDRFSCLCCVHVALLGTTLQFFHKTSLEKICQKLINHISDLKEMRLKDIERLLVSITMFDFNPKTDVDIYDTIFKEIQAEQRRKEFIQYPRCLPSVLNLLSMRKKYPYELINEVLCHDRIVEIYGKYPKFLPRDLLSLDICIETECPDYNGKRIDKTFRQKAAKWMVEYTPTWDQSRKLQVVDKFYLAVQDTVAKIVGGHENVHTDHILPNFVKSDIIVCKDKNGKFVQPIGFENYLLGDVMYPSNPDLKWYAIIPLSWNNTIRNSTVPLGLITMKCRLLKTVGYEPVLVTWSDFLNIQPNKQIEYIKSKIM